MRVIGKTMITLGAVAAFSAAAITGVHLLQPQKPGETTPKTLTMVALGDSMSIASNSCGDTDTCPATSWSTGTDKTVNSLANRIRTTTGQKVNVENYAHIGDKADALQTQIPKALADKPDIITILMGANDVCAAQEPAEMTPADDYNKTINQAIDIIHARLPRTRILLASVPNPTNLWDNLHTNQAAVNKWGSNVCAVALKPGDDQTANDRRAAVTNQVNTYNKILATIAANRKAYVIYDSGAVNSFKYAPAVISTIDYLHPNKTGQADIANQVWQAPGVKAFLTR